MSTIDYSPYLGRVGIGRVERGGVRVGQQVALLPAGPAGLVEDDLIEPARVTQLYGFEGVNRVEIDSAEAGDIIAIAGIEGVEIGTTLTDTARVERMTSIAVEEPTISVDFMVNNSPFAGQVGKNPHFLVLAATLE